MDRYAAIKDRFLCDKPLDSRDIGWLIDEVDHLKAELSYTRNRLHRLEAPARIET